MARPVKKRKVCELPKREIFGPLGCDEGKNNIVNMTVDEYETIRLIDHENLTQEECAEQMDIARATVQRIYSDARYKISDAIVNGRALNIEGGHYKLCPGRSEKCGMKRCSKKVIKNCTK